MSPLICQHTERQEAVRVQDAAPRGSLRQPLVHCALLWSTLNFRRNRSHCLPISFLGAICTFLQMVFCMVILAELQTIKTDINLVCSSTVDNKGGFPWGEKKYQRTLPQTQDIKTCFSFAENTQSQKGTGNLDEHTSNNNTPAVFKANIFWFCKYECGQSDGRTYLI